MRVFYDLSAPSTSDFTKATYGRPARENQFGRAEWTDAVHDSVPGIICRVDPNHRRAGDRTIDIRVILSSPRIGDFTWTWHNECLVTDRVLYLFQKAGFIGFDSKPVTIEKVERLRKDGGVSLPALWELAVMGKGGEANPESGIRVINQCEECGLVKYSSYRNGIIVDEHQWDGSDFFTINGYPRHILVTERVKDLIIANKLTNCILAPSHEVRWPEGVGRPEDLQNEIYAMASRDLASLLADLESSDTSKWMKTAFALGEKREPSAIDFLLQGFSHQDPIIRDSAASAVARIAGHIETPQDVRKGAFLKLSSLLGHSNPLVRGTAATTLGLIGDERAGEDVMRLLQDPEESVRRTAVFVIGLIAYKPAVEAIKGLMRDRNRSVRETAERVLREFASRKTNDSD